MLGYRYLCDWFDVSPAGYYKWCSRRESERDKENRTLSAKIERIFYAQHTNYGSPRIHKVLQQRGERVNHKRVERLMREMGLVGKAGRVYRQKALAKRFYAKLPNLKKDLPIPTAINQQWVGDLTYLSVNGQKRYLATVMDLYSRRILGWSLGKQKTAELTRAALKKALRHRTIKAGLIFHTDRGPEYGAYLIQNELEQAGIKPSMNRPYKVTDNAHMESFFQTMKTECIREVHFKTEHELRMTLSWYLNDYYNKRRLHSSIDYTSPVDYEKMAA